MDDEFLSDELGSGVVTVPIAIMYACGYIKYEEAKAFAFTLRKEEAPNSFAELCQQLKKAKDRADLTLMPPVSGS